MVYRYALWQQALGMLMWGLLAVCIVVFFKALFQILLRRSLSAKKDGKIVLGSLCCGFSLCLLLWKTIQPQAISTDDSINTPQHFRRYSPPRIDIEAPPGWTIEYQVDQAKKKLDDIGSTAIQGFTLFWMLLDKLLNSLAFKNRVSCSRTRLQVK